MTTLTIDENGTVTLLAELRAQLGLVEGTTLVAEPREGGVLLRPAHPAANAEDEAEQFFAKFARQVAAARADPEVWAEELAERALWDSTLLDGLEDEPWEEMPARKVEG